jgi:hypothetical protein
MNGALVFSPSASRYKVEDPQLYVVHQDLHFSIYILPFLKLITNKFR